MKRGGSIKEIMKLRANDMLYGNAWQHEGWRRSYINSFKQYLQATPTNEQHISFISLFGGSGVSGGSTNPENDLGFTIKDSFVKFDTKSMLYGKQITPYYSAVLMEIVKYYEKQKDITGNTEIKEKIIRYIHKIFEENGNMNLPQLMRYFNAQTIECLLAYLLIAYQTNRLDLILRATYTFGRVLPLKCKSEWFDNYRLNAYGNVLNMVMYKRFDENGIFTIEEEPKPINENVKLSFYPKVLKFLVGSLRMFIIINELDPKQIKSKMGGNSGFDETPTNQPTNGNESLTMMTGGKKKLTQSFAPLTTTPQTDELPQTGQEDHTMNETEFAQLFDPNNGDNENVPDFINAQTLAENEYQPNDMFYTNEMVDPMDNDVMRLLMGSGKSGYSDEQICDECYKRYPFFFGGAHGCDVFGISNMSLSIDEITQFLNRYPSARVGYILNTATYRSGRGQHWVALELTLNHAKLICSQRSDFTVFSDGGELIGELKSHRYNMEHNDKNIQTDNYACGTYAFISLMELLRYGDIHKAVERIGVNMSSLGEEKGKKSSADIVRANVVGWEK